MTIDALISKSTAPPNRLSGHSTSSPTEPIHLPWNHPSSPSIGIKRQYIASSESSSWSITDDELQEMIDREDSATWDAADTRIAPSILPLCKLLVDSNASEVQARDLDISEE
jgi:hypothetical protein